VEVVNKSLKTILQRTINSAKSNWHLMLYSTLWAYQTSIKTATGFSPFQLVYGMEAVFPIECQIPSLKLAVELLPNTTMLEECLIYLEQLDEQRRDATLANEAHKHVSSVNMIGRSTLEFSLKVILSWSMIKIKIPWGQENLNPCGSDHLLLRKFWKKVLMNWLTLKVMLFLSPEMGFILRSIMLRLVT
jgi:hypothetical protein